MKTRSLKIFVCLLAFIAILYVCVILLVACNEGDPANSDPIPQDPPPHTHKYELTEVPATCTENGSKTYACDCGASYSEEIPMLGHDMQWESDGENHWQQCSRCENKTDPVPHNFGTVISVEKQPSCTEKGKQTVGCECGKTVAQDIPMTEHKFTVHNKDDVEHWTECEVCHVDQPNTRAKHDYATVVSVTQSTCTTAGQKITKCDCGATKTEQLKLESHDFQYHHDESAHWMQCETCQTVQDGSRSTHQMKVTSSTDATCTVDGSRREECVCGVFQTVTLPSLGHNWDKSTFSDKTDEEHYYTCSRCGDILQEEHTFVNVDSAENKQPTCGAEGHQDKQCSVCEYIVHETIPATGKHVWSADFQHDAECHWNYCTVCNAQSEHKTHEWVWKTQIEPTCTDNGSERAECACGRTGETRNKSKLGHDFIETENKPATCTEDGVKKEKCNRCGLERTTVLQAQNHLWYSTDEGRIDPTCTSLGSHVEICDRCGERRTVVDEHLGYADHNPVYYPEKAPTETEDGWYTHWQCTVCGQYFTTKNCAEKMTEEQVIRPALTAHRLQNIAEFNEVAAGLQGSSTSTNLYEITLKVFYIEGNALVLTDDEDLIEVVIGYEYTQYNTLKEDYLVTLRGHICNSANGATFSDAVITDVDCGDPDIFSLFVSVEITAGRPNLTITHEKSNPFNLGAWYSKTQLVSFECLLLGETVTFSYTDYGKNVGGKMEYSVLSWLVINGKSYTATDGKLEITVEEDIHAELVFGYYNTNNVETRTIATDTNAEDITVDPYVSYQYVNGRHTNGGNRLYAGSHLRFTVSNAYITRIEIVFEEFENMKELTNNTVYVGSDNDHKTRRNYEQDALTLLLQFDELEHIFYFEYNAVVQARVSYIKIHYATYNT